MQRFALSVLLTLCLTLPLTAADLVGFTDAPITTGVPARTGVGSTLLLTSSGGTYVESVTIQSLGNNPRAVVRIFFNDGTGTDASDYALYRECTLPSTDASEDEAIPVHIVRINKWIPDTQRIYVAISKNGDSGWDVIAWGGDYYARQTEEISRSGTP